MRTHLLRNADGFRDGAMRCAHPVEQGRPSHRQDVLPMLLELRQKQSGQQREDQLKMACEICGEGTCYCNETPYSEVRAEASNTLGLLPDEPDRVRIVKLELVIKALITELHELKTRNSSVELRVGKLEAVAR